MIRFKRVPGLPGYAAKTDSSIWSEWTWKGKIPQMYRCGKWRRCRTNAVCNGGYPMLSVTPGISPTGKRLQLRVHRLLLLTFVGPCPEGMECRHLDGNPTNCKLENLAWGTPVENSADKEEHGTINRGERNGGSKLTETEVLEIRELLKTMTRKRVAEIYKVSLSAIIAIKHMKYWTHL